MNITDIYERLKTRSNLDGDVQIHVHQQAFDALLRHQVFISNQITLMVARTGLSEDVCRELYEEMATNSYEFDEKEVEINAAERKQYLAEKRKTKKVKK